MGEHQIFKCVHGQGSFVADYRFYPIIIFKWEGAAENELMDHLYELRNTEGLRGEPPWTHIYVMDLIDSPPPTATVRKHLAEKQLNDPHLENLRTLSIPIVTNALLRGVMTAVIWMTGKEKLATEFAGSMSEALRKAFRTLDRWDVPHPEGLDPDTYKFPDHFDVVFRQT